MRPRVGFARRAALAAVLAASLVGTSALAQAPSDSLTGPGVSLALARQRAATVHDVRYALHLDVTALDSAVGTVSVQWRRTGNGPVILDFRGRRITAMRVNGDMAPPAWFNG